MNLFLGNLILTSFCILDIFVLRETSGNLFHLEYISSIL